MSVPVRRVAACAAVVLAGLVGLAGCVTDPQESSVDVAANSESARVTAFGAADQAVDLARTLNPDLQFELDFDPSFDNEWYDCGDGTRADTEAPEVIQWLAYRTLYLEPHRETATLLAPIVDELVADGWTLGRESTPEGARTLTVTRDGFTLTVAGETEGLPDRVSTVGIQVSSPCIIAPEGVLDWTATPTPTDTALPTAAASPTPTP